MKRVHLLVSGRVQGVFYRAECESIALSLGLSGFVRNLPDGRVEAVFEGNDSDVDSAVDRCRSGSKLARVEEVEVEETPPSGGRGFRIL